MANTTESAGQLRQECFNLVCEHNALFYAMNEPKTINFSEVAAPYDQCRAMLQAKLASTKARHQVRFDRLATLMEASHAVAIKLGYPHAIRPLFFTEESLEWVERRLEAMKREYIEQERQVLTHEGDQQGSHQVAHQVAHQGAHQESHQGSQRKAFTHEESVHHLMDYRRRLREDRRRKMNERQERMTKHRSMSWSHIQDDLPKMWEALYNQSLGI